MISSMKHDSGSAQERLAHLPYKGSKSDIISGTTANWKHR
jgi:hypothetical protein